MMTSTTTSSTTTTSSSTPIPSVPSSTDTSTADPTIFTIGGDMNTETIMAALEYLRKAQDANISKEMTRINRGCSGVLRNH